MTVNLSTILKFVIFQFSIKNQGSGSLPYLCYLIKKPKPFSIVPQARDQKRKGGAAKNQIKSLELSILFFFNFIKYVFLDHSKKCKPLFDLKKKFFSLCRLYLFSGKCDR